MYKSISSKIQSSQGHSTVSQQIRNVLIAPKQHSHHSSSDSLHTALTCVLSSPDRWASRWWSNGCWRCVPGWGGCVQCLTCCRRGGGHVRWGSLGIHQYSAGSASRRQLCIAERRLVSTMIGMQASYRHVYQ